MPLGTQQCTDASPECENSLRSSENSMFSDYILSSDDEIQNSQEIGTTEEFILCEETFDENGIDDRISKQEKDNYEPITYNTNTKLAFLSTEPPAFPTSFSRDQIVESTAEVESGPVVSITNWGDAINTTNSNQARRTKPILDPIIIMESSDESAREENSMAKENFLIRKPATAICTSQNNPQISPQFTTGPKGLSCSSTQMSEFQTNSTCINVQILQLDDLSRRNSLEGEPDFPAKAAFWESYGKHYTADTSFSGKITPWSMAKVTDGNRWIQPREAMEHKRRMYPQLPLTGPMRRIYALQDFIRIRGEQLAHRKLQAECQRRKQEEEAENMRARKEEVKRKELEVLNAALIRALEPKDEETPAVQSTAKSPMPRSPVSIRGSLISQGSFTLSAQTLLKEALSSQISAGKRLKQPMVTLPSAPRLLVPVAAYAQLPIKKDARSLAYVCGFQSRSLSR